MGVGTAPGREGSSWACRHRQTDADHHPGLVCSPMAPHNLPGRTWGGVCSPWLCGSLQGTVLRWKQQALLQWRPCLMGGVCQAQGEPTQPFAAAVILRQARRIPFWTVDRSPRAQRGVPAVTDTLHTIDPLPCPLKHPAQIPRPHRLSVMAAQTRDTPRFTHSFINAVITEHPAF